MTLKYHFAKKKTNNKQKYNRSCVGAQFSQLVCFCFLLLVCLLTKYSVSLLVSFPCCLCVTVRRKQQQSVQHRQADGADDERPQGSGQRDQQLPRVGSGGVQQRWGQHAQHRAGEEEEWQRPLFHVWCVIKNKEISRHTNTHTHACIVEEASTHSRVANLGLFDVEPERRIPLWLGLIWSFLFNDTTL